MPFRDIFSCLRKRKASGTHMTPPDHLPRDGPSPGLTFVPASGPSPVVAQSAVDVPSVPADTTPNEHLTLRPANSRVPSHTEPVFNATPTSHFLENSHHNVFNHPTIVSVSNTFDSEGGAIMRLLESKTIRGAAHDSAARYPPPRCHPETRKTLKGEIVHWVANPRRGWRMFYVLGPAGVGKSAVAQTVADETDYLGASCFISRPNGRNDPDGVIPTLAYQLAVKHTAYKQIISSKIAHDPTILGKTRRVQFKELLVDPFHLIMTRDISSALKPLLMIIDGLDECEDEGAQCEFIELIGNHVRSFPQFPLLWLICSRPEPHLKYTLSQADFQITCRREDMSVDNEEGRQDVLLYLREEFRNIQLRHQDSLDHNWPPEAFLLRIATAASGLFAFASTVVRFVGDAKTGDPSSQLRICLKALGGSRASAGRNPYLTLDLLYQHILSSIPSEILQTTMRILGMTILYPDRGPSRSVQTLANFFLIGKAAFYHASKQLHSIVRIPSSSDAFTKGIEFYHASFADFLRDPARSGKFYLDEAAVHYDIALTGLRWHTSLWRELQEDDIWVSPLEDVQECFKTTKSQSLTVLWVACSRVRGEKAANVYQELQSFDFNVLGLEIPSEWEFGEFLIWLDRQEAKSWTWKLSSSLSNYMDCSPEQFTRASVPRPKLAGLTRESLSSATGIHFDLGNGKMRRHIHIRTARSARSMISHPTNYFDILRVLAGPDLSERPRGTRPLS